MAQHEIGIWFLLLSLFLPRTVLLFWWITGNLPYNTTPFLADLFASIFVPRVLIVVWIYDIQGMSAWFWVHLAMLCFVWLGNALRVVRGKS
jgi:hypothetical protein